MKMGEIDNMRGGVGGFGCGGPSLLESIFVPYWCVWKLHLAEENIRCQE